MAICFQTFKKNLKKDFVKKELTPNFENKYQKLRPQWDAFVQYTLAETTAQLVNKNKDNAQLVGYATTIPKFEKMESDLLAKGIEPMTLRWTKLAKWYFYAHGGKINPDDGALITSEYLQEAVNKLETALKAKAEGNFMPNREKDELTYALGNPEHTGRVRGMGIIPWKHGFSEDLETYRSRSRSKTAQEEQFRSLEERVAATEEKIK